MYKNNPGNAQSKIDQWNRGKWINESFLKKFHLYNINIAKHFAREMNYIILVEGYFDALILSEYKLPNTVALCGTYLSEWHTATISRYCRHVVTIFDPDEAGKKALI